MRARRWRCGAEGVAPGTAAVAAPCAGGSPLSRDPMLASGRRRWVRLAQRGGAGAYYPGLRTLAHQVDVLAKHVQMLRVCERRFDLVDRVSMSSSRSSISRSSSCVRRSSSSSSISLSGVPAIDARADAPAIQRGQQAHQREQYCDGGDQEDEQPVHQVRRPERQGTPQQGRSRAVVAGGLGAERQFRIVCERELVASRRTTSAWSGSRWRRASRR